MKKKRKKVFAGLLVACLAAGSAAYPNYSQTAYAAPLEETAEIPEQHANNEDWYWIEKEDGTISIQEYAGSDTEVEIPSILDGKEVTEINFGFTAENDSITSIKMPDTVKIIGDYAFLGCVGLREIKLSNQITKIGESAFSGCGHLYEITLPDSLESIGDEAFAGCWDYDENTKLEFGLTQITIPEKVSHIGEKVFEGCNILEKIDVASQNAVFASEDGILFNKAKTELLLYPIGKKQTSYSIPSSVQKIEDSAFASQEYLEELSFPGTLNSIGESAGKSLSGCLRLKRVDVDSQNPAFFSEDGVLFNKAKTELLFYPAGKQQASYSIPSGVQNIGDSAFPPQDYLEEISFPDTMQSIRESSFSSLSLKEITIPASISSIEKDAFSYSSAKNITVDAANASYCSVDGVLFNKEKTLLIAYPGEKPAERYVVPEGVKEIGQNAFGGTLSLLQILVSKNVEKISEDAFFFSAIEDITIANPQCVIGREPSEDDPDWTIPERTCIHGYENSTAQAYAQQNGNPFQVITGEICQHSYDGNTTAPSTCIQPGTITYTCSKCGDSYTESLPLGDHVYTEAISSPPTCKQKGIKTYTCTLCKDSYTEEIPLTSHNYQTVTKRATATKDGSIQNKCAFCGNVAESRTIPFPKSASLSKSSVTYNGKAQKVSVTVKDRLGKTISSNNYSVTYSNNKNVEEASVTVAFCGNYSGIMKKTFRILPKSTSLSKVSAKSKGFSAKWKKQASQTTGYQIQYSTNSKFSGKATKTITVKKNNATAKTISKLKGNKKYYVRICTYKSVKIKGKTISLSSAWSKTKSVKTKK